MVLTDIAFRTAGRAVRRAAWDQTLPIELIGRSAWLHVSGISQAISAQCCDAVFAALEHAHQTGTRISYDLNWRPLLWPRARALAVARATLRLCDLFLPSVDEIHQLIDIVQPEDIVRWAHDQGARQVVLKLGARGALVSDGGCMVLIPPLQVRSVDATGAGDAFAGALLARLAAGDDLVTAARAAAVAAALSTTGMGATDPLPKWEDVAVLLRSWTKLRH
jgi:2-dehydro-3-deoxygluconokinase